jgi:hypothetical protein
MASCPLALRSNKVNVKNHLIAIEEANLGPEDPRISNEDFWKQKAMRWMTTEGLARGRLCANCEYYNNTSEIEDCIANGPAYNFKTSSVNPKLVDIEDHPLAYCTKFEITCSPTRTCDEQEMGGPMDDARMESEEGPTLEYSDLTKSSLED